MRDLQKTSKETEAKIDKMMYGAIVSEMEKNAIETNEFLQRYWWSINANNHLSSKDSSIGQWSLPKISLLIVESLTEFAALSFIKK